MYVISTYLFRYGRDYYINQSEEKKAMQKQVSVNDVGTLEKSIVYGTLPRTTFSNQKGTRNFAKNPIYSEDF